MKRHIYILALLVLVSSCSRENPIGYVGQPITVTVDIPDENEDLEFLWELTSIPEDSYLINTDIQAGNDSYSVIFIPDVIGDYSIEASVFQYNDEVETQSFTFSVNEALKVDATPIAESDKIILDTLALAELLLSEDSESNWYDSYLTNDNLSYSVIDTISSLDDDSKYERNNPPQPAKKIAKKKKEIKGQSIPFDKNRFTIQIASKRKLDDAKKVAGKLIESGYDAYIQKANFKKSNEVWFRIRVGSYDNRQTASAVAESLSKTQKETAWVDFVRYEN